MSHGCEQSNRSPSPVFSSRFPIRPSFAAVGLALLLAGCGGQGRSSDAGVQSSADGKGPLPELSAYAYRYPDRPPVLDAEGLKAFVGRFKNQVVVIQFWASWSRQSRDDIAVLADLHDELRDQGLRVIACTVDPSEEWATRIVPILMGAGANFPCVVIPREARAGIREWLAPKWSYDLPARILVDRRGRVVARSFGKTPITMVAAQAREMVSDPGPTVTFAKSPGGGSSLRAKLVNVATGEWESLPVAVAGTSDADALGEELASYVAARLDRTSNQRIAVLPFPSSADRRRASAFGMAVSRQVEKGLRHRGFYDLMGPLAADRLVSRARLTPMAIDYDPGIVQGRLGVDYLILGWVKNDTGRYKRRSLIAVDSSGGNPGAD